MAAAAVAQYYLVVSVLQHEQFCCSSGNVFGDLGFSSEEAELLKAKAQLRIKIEREVKRRKLTPKSLAEILGVKQSQVSDLLTGKVSKMTLDKLFKYSHRLGMRTDIKTVKVRSPAT